MSFHSFQSRFIEGERVLKEWTTKEWNWIFSTQYRIFFVNKGRRLNGFVEVPFNHITSLEFSRHRPTSRLFPSMASFILCAPMFFIPSIMGMSQILSQYIYLIGIFLAMAGLGLFIWFLLGEDIFVINIDGRKPILLSKELSDLFVYARNYLKANMDSEHMLADHLQSQPFLDDMTRNVT